MTSSPSASPKAGVPAALPVSNFNVPATIIFGGGALRELAPQLRRLGVTRALLVTDEFMVRS